MIQGARDAALAEKMTPETPIRLDFERPPLVEQAISVVFEPVEGFGIVDYGLFWQHLAAEFPEVATEPPIQAPTELFGEPASMRVSFNLAQLLPLPRAMFRNARGELVQIQPDRFGFNWAKEEDIPYPRSEVVMARFEELFSTFREFVDDRSLGSIRLRQCELTNLNVIPVSDFGHGYEDIHRALAVDPLDLGISFLKAETFVRNRQHRIVEDGGQSIGRLHTSIQPVVSSQDNSQGYKLELTARSGPTIRSIDEARWFFAVARNAINGAFSAMVTPEMKEKWGEKNG